MDPGSSVEVSGFGFLLVFRFLRILYPRALEISRSKRMHLAVGPWMLAIERQSLTISAPQFAIQ